MLIGEVSTSNAIGKATSPTLTDNRFCDVATPVVTEPLITGVTESGHNFARSLLQVRKSNPLLC